MVVNGDDHEKAGEKPAQQEEREGLLNEYQIEESGGFKDQGLKRGPLSRGRFWIALCAAIVVLLGSSLLLYQLSLSGHLFTNESYGSEREQQTGLAIRLSPQSHRHRQPRTISHEWDLTQGIRAPDGVDKQVYLINGNCFPYFYTSALLIKYPQANSQAQQSKCAQATGWSSTYTTS